MQVQRGVSETSNHIFYNKLKKICDATKKKYKVDEVSNLASSFLYFLVIATQTRCTTSNECNKRDNQEL